jgi:hypothetical protein
VETSRGQRQDQRQHDNADERPAPPRHRTNRNIFCFRFHHSSLKTIIIQNACPLHHRCSRKEAGCPSAYFIGYANLADAWKRDSTTRGAWNGIVSRSDMHNAIVRLQESEKRVEQERLAAEEQQKQIKAQIGHNQGLWLSLAHPVRLTSAS